MSIEQDVRNWSQEVLETPNKRLNGLPACPYAKKAWVDNKVYVHETSDLIKDAVTLRTKALTDYDLVIVASYQIPESQALNQTMQAFNLICAKENLYFMCFHPEYGAEDAELDFLYEHDWESSIEEDYAMIFIQKLTDVDDKSRHLEKLGYYQAFKKDEYETLVLQRRQLRNQYHGDETSCNEKE
jgi:hypothetical protein